MCTIISAPRAREFGVADCPMVFECGSPFDFAPCSFDSATEAFSDGAGKAGEAGEAFLCVKTFPPSAAYYR